MSSITVVWRNLWRNKVRTVLTMCSVAASLYLFTFLRGGVESMEAVAANAAGQLRLVVHQKSTMTKLLPLSYGPKIAALPGVQAVCAMRWFGGRLEGTQSQFPSLAADVDSFPHVYSDFDLTADEITQWRTKRQAAVVGRDLSQRMGWSRGQRVTLKGTVPPYLPLEFHIVGITSAPAYPNLFIFRLDYLLEAQRASHILPPEHEDAVNFYWVKADSPLEFDALRKSIDELFAQTPSATRTEPEEAFVAQFTQMFGDLPRIINAVGLVVMASTLSVISHAMSVAVRERIGELALLKALGFSTPRILALVVCESAFAGFLGGLIGAVLALASSGRSFASAMGMPYLPLITVSSTAFLGGVTVGVLIGCLAGLAPARRIATLSVTAILRERR